MPGNYNSITIIKQHLIINAYQLTIVGPNDRILRVIFSENAREMHSKTQKNNQIHRAPFSLSEPRWGPLYDPLNYSKTHEISESFTKSDEFFDSVWSILFWRVVGKSRKFRGSSVSAELHSTIFLLSRHNLRTMHAGQMQTWQQLLLIRRDFMHIFNIYWVMFKEVCLYFKWTSRIPCPSLTSLPSMMHVDP